MQNPDVIQDAAKAAHNVPGGQPCLPREAGAEAGRQE